VDSQLRLQHDNALSAEISYPLCPSVCCTITEVFKQVYTRL